MNILIAHSSNGAFQGHWNQMMKHIIQMNKTWSKIPNWQEADQLAIYKRDRGNWGIELGSTDATLNNRHGVKQKSKAKMQP